jgi:Ca2+-binding EF-hand superfamily protein
MMCSMLCCVLCAVLCAVCRGERLKLKDLAAAMAAMDTDESGRIELEEFQQWWADNGESANQPYMYSTLLPRANER